MHTPPPNPKRPLAIIPCFNEARKELESTLKKWFSACDIIVIDDGSSPPVEIKGFPGILVLRHNENQGQGAAIRSGLLRAMETDADFFLTVDADGQHPVDNLDGMLEELKSGKVDIVFGSRFMEETQNIPLGRYWILKLARLFNNFVTGVSMTDVHNGLRAMNRNGARALAGITENRMAHASEIPILVKIKGLRWKEAPVEIHYSDYSTGKGQSLWQVFPLFFKLIRLKLKYANKQG